MSKSKSENQFLIAGGGIGGLAAAIALGRMDISVRVLESTEKFSDEGAGIQLGPNATKSWSSGAYLTGLPEKPSFQKALPSAMV